MARPVLRGRQRSNALALPDKLANYLSGRYGRTDPARMPHRIVRIGRERVRRILHSHDITFQRTRTWKESTDPAKDAKLDRIEEVISRFPDRVFAFDQFGPLSIRPCHGTCWAREKHPDRLPATYHRYHGVRYFHGCYDLARDQLWGVLHEHKGGAHTLAALKSVRAARPEGAPIYIVLDNLSCNTTAARHGQQRTRSSCARPRRTPAGPTRSRRSSGPCERSRWPTPTTPATPPWPADCTPTCAGATPTPATRASWTPSAANAPAPAARKATAGDGPSPAPPDQPGDPSGSAH